MSQTPSQPNEIGRAVVPFVGDTSNVKKAAAEAVAVTKAAVQEINRDMASASTSVGAAGGGSTADGTPGGGSASGGGFDKDVRQSFTRLRAAAAAAGAAIGLADQALKGFVSARSEVEALANSFREINDTGGALRSLFEGGDSAAKAFRDANAQLDAMAATLTKAKEDELFSISGIFDRFAREVTGADNPFVAQLEAILQKKKELATLSEQVRATNEQDAIDQADAALSSAIRKQIFSDLLSAQREGISVANEQLDEEGRINKELDDRIDKLGSIRDRAESAGELTPALTRELDRLENGFRDAARRGLEAGAKDALGVISKEIASVQMQAANMFPTDKLSLQLTELAKIMERVASNTKNING